MFLVAGKEVGLVHGSKPKPEVVSKTKAGLLSRCYAVVGEDGSLAALN